MTISSSIHGAKAMTAHQRDMISWLEVETDSGHGVIFMPMRVAQATARAFNYMTDAVSAEKAALAEAVHTPAAHEVDTLMQGDAA